jgi:hypothetical protein
MHEEKKREVERERGRKKERKKERARFNGLNYVITNGRTHRLCTWV